MANSESHPTKDHSPKRNEPVPPEAPAASEAPADPAGELPVAEPLDDESTPAPLSPVPRPQPPVESGSLPPLSAVEALPVAEEIDVASLCDEELMKWCQEGDEGAFEVLFQRYEGPALSFIFRMIGDRTRTEALGQEAFLRIFKDARSYQYPRSFATWFYTIVRNLCKNELRWRARHPTVSIEENLDRSERGSGGDGLQLGDNLRARGSSPLDQLVGDELVGKLSAAVRELPELECEILILNRFQGLKYREIAEVVGLPVGTVRSRIHAALERLRKAVKDYL